MNIPRIFPLAVLISAALAWPLTTHAQQAYPTPDAAAQALVDALGTQRADAAKLAQLLGKDWREFIPLEGVERADVDAFLAGYRARHRIRADAAGRASLLVGAGDWSFPIPLAKGA